MKAFAAVAPDTIMPIELPIPEIGEYEVLVENEACVICNSTDYLVVNDLFCTPSYPVVFGHESVGRVIKKGSKVKYVNVGDRITRSNAIPTGFNGKYYSSWGGFSEYGVAGDYKVLQEEGLEQESWKYLANKVLPQELSLEEASMVIALSETASCIMQLEDIKGKSVVVYGTGIAGLSLVLFSKLFGAKTLICLGRRQERLEAALKLGADHVMLWDDTGLADKIKEIETEGFDYIFEAAGKKEVFKNGLPYLKNGGKICIYGISLNPYLMNINNAPGDFSISRFNPKEYIATDYVCDLIKKKKIPIDVLLTHSWGFDALPDAMEQVKRGEVIKGIVKIKE